MLLLVGFVTRLGGMSRSLWLDEAWVANSITAPTWSQMFFYDRWAQSTPPGYLAVTRAWLGIAGESEVALRTVPFAATVFSVILLALALRRIFSPALAILGAAFAVANFWLMKYAEQGKQYSCDLFMAALFLWLIWRYQQGPPERPGYLALAISGVAGVFLSYTTLFWFPAMLLGMVLPEATAAAAGRLPSPSATERWTRAVPLGALYSAAVLAAWWFFLRPNRTARLVEKNSDRFLFHEDLRTTITGFWDNVSALLVAHVAWWAVWISYVVAALVAVGAMRAGWQAWQGDTRARSLCVACGIPLLTGMAMSAAGQYPLMWHARFLIWMLPGFIVFLLYAIEPAWKWLGELTGGWLEGPAGLIILTMLCVGFTAALRVVERRFPDRAERPREAMLFLKEHMKPGEPLYVHGAMTEQFYYYRRFLKWSPEKIYWGNSGWPCCPIGVASRVTNPAMKELRPELQDFAAGVPGDRLWIFVTDAQFTPELRAGIERIERTMEEAGWRTAGKETMPGLILYEMTRAAPAPAE